MPKVLTLPEVRRPTTLRTLAYFTAASMLLSALLVLLGHYTPAYALTVDGVALGPVAGQEMVEETISQVEGQISLILGEDYTMDVEQDYRLTLASRDSLVGYAALSEQLYTLCPEIKPAYILSVDNVEVATAMEKSELDAALTDLRASYRTENTQQLYFANTTRIARRYVPADTTYLSRSKVLEAVTSPSMAAELQGPMPQPLSDTAAAESMALQTTAPAEETELNPLLSVYTVERIEETRVVESPVREVMDNSIYEGDRVVTTEGQSGEVAVVADVLYLNGEPKTESLLSVQVLSPVSDTVVSVGTLERPRYVGMGTYQWPCAGTVTSPFGTRDIFGSQSFHGGMDIANSAGTAIVAADSGIVTFAGNQGTYGNYIIVDHGNGQETLYAHCSELLVQEGDGVLQGQQIAAMGATGRATGSHCHFEVRVNGEKVNPATFLP